MITAHQFAENKVTPQQSSFLHRGVCGLTQNQFGDIPTSFSSLAFFKAPPLCASDNNTDVRITGNVNYKLLKVMPLFDISKIGASTTTLVMRVHGWSSVVQGSKQNELFVPFLINEINLSYNTNTATIDIPSIYRDNSITALACRGASVVTAPSTPVVPVAPLLFNPSGDVADKEPAYFIIDTQGAQYLQFSMKDSDSGSSKKPNAYTALLTPYSL